MAKKIQSKNQLVQDRKHDKKSMQLMKRYEKARTTHGKLMRKSLTTGNFKKTVPARHKMENALHNLQIHMNKKRRK